MNTFKNFLLGEGKRPPFYDKRTFVDSPFFAPGLMILLGILPFSFWYFLPPQTCAWVVQENGIVENATVVLYALAAVIALWLRPADNNRAQNIAFAVFIFLIISLMARELDAQLWIPSQDTTAFKINFFRNPKNPIGEKILAGAIVLMYIGVAIYLLRRYALFLIRGVFKLKTLPWTIGTLGAITIFAKIIDRMPANYQKATGIAYTVSEHALSSAFEECYEMYMPILIILAVIQFARKPGAHLSPITAWNVIKYQFRIIGITRRRLDVCSLTIILIGEMHENLGTF